MFMNSVAHILHDGSVHAAAIPTIAVEVTVQRVGCVLLSDDISATTGTMMGMRSRMEALNVWAEQQFQLFNRRK
jgi:hypothetical protein